MKTEATTRSKNMGQMTQDEFICCRGTNILIQKFKIKKTSQKYRLLIVIFRTWNWIAVITLHKSSHPTEPGQDNSASVSSVSVFWHRLSLNPSAVSVEANKFDSLYIYKKKKILGGHWTPSNRQWKSNWSSEQTRTSSWRSWTYLFSLCPERTSQTPSSVGAIYEAWVSGKLAQFNVKTMSWKKWPARLSRGPLHFAACEWWRLSDVKQKTNVLPKGVGHFSFPS